MSIANFKQFSANSNYYQSLILEVADLVSHCCCWSQSSFWDLFKTNKKRKVKTPPQTSPEPKAINDLKKNKFSLGYFFAFGNAYCSLF